MSGSTFGKIFQLTTFGESHGAAIGGVVDGCPAGLKLDMAAVQQAVSYTHLDVYKRQSLPEAGIPTAGRIRLICAICGHETQPPKGGLKSCKSCNPVKKIMSRTAQTLSLIHI